MIPRMEPARVAKSPSAEDVDHRVFLHGVSWEQYEALDALRGESSVPRLTYLDGELELMSPSRHHETDKSLLGRLVVAYAEEMDIDLNAYGSWTLKKQVEKVAAEPDECYVVGDHDVERPDFAIEVVWTSGGISKLEVYRRLEVPEVWFYQHDRLRFYRLGRNGYREIPRSRFLPGFEPDLVIPFLRERNQSRAVRAFREALRARLTNR